MCSRHWFFWCDWRTGERRAVRSLGPLWNFCLLSSQRRKRPCSRPRKRGAGSFCRSVVVGSVVIAEDANRLSSGQSVEEFANGPLQHRVLHIGRDFGQWSKHEASLVHRRMRNSQLFRVDDPVGEEKDIDIDDARAFSLDALPAHFALDVENVRHQLLRSVPGFESYRAIQKPRLVSELDRLSLVERRN